MHCISLVSKASIINRSHAFIPYDIDDHTGVYYPSGAVVVGEESEKPSLVVAYGKGDDRVMLMELSHDLVTEYLMPLGPEGGQGRARVGPEGGQSSGGFMHPRDYKFCTVGLASKK